MDLNTIRKKFPVGSIVTHKDYGNGKVTGYARRGKGYALTVELGGVGEVTVTWYDENITNCDHALCRLLDWI